MNFNFKKLPPFKWFVLQNFPFIEADFDAITYYQLLCKIVEYLNKVIDENNAIGEQTENLTEAYNELQSYVEHYFDNLDVQEEINNKLDEMAESGQLTDIIAQYLQLSGILAYNTINDLKNAENLVNGSFAKTYGKNSYNDGLGAFYKIRNVLNTDVIDNDNIVALANFNNLVAEKIKLTLSKKFLLLGDSYGEGYSADGNVESWCIKFKNKMNLNNSNCNIVVGGGKGFGVSNNFIDLIQNMESDIYLTDIILLGGYNDITVGYYNIKTGMENFKNLCNQKFPNAKIYIGFVGWSNNPSKLVDLRFASNFYIQSCKELNINYLNNIDYSLHEYFNCFSSDDFHPNNYGQEQITNNLINAYNTGNANVTINYSNFNLGFNYDFTTNDNIEQIITTNLINNSIYFSIKNKITLNCNNKHIICDNTIYDIADITAGVVIGNNFYTTDQVVNCVIHNEYDYITIPGILIIADKKLKIAFFDVRDDKKFFREFDNVSDIQIQPLSFYIDASIN
jgi:hypothetical protein